MATTIGFIGGGNMARSLIGGLLAGGIDARAIWVADADENQLNDIQKNFGVRTTADNQEIVQHSTVVALAVKPQAIKTVAMEIAEAVQARHPLVISIAAGIRLADLGKWLGPGIAIVRTMPNTPALVKSGATALVANSLVTPEQQSQAESILRAVGLALWLDDESLMDAVTALSGSGPAYFFLVMEAIEKAGRQLGLPADTAHLLTLQTAFGAAKMALESKADSAELRERVTSPGGTTEQAINVLKDHKLEEAFTEALEAAHRRSVELANALGDK